MELPASDDFKQTRGHIPGIGDVILVTPSKMKKRWTSEELKFRSLMVLANNTDCIVSTGFPKFFNYGEVPENDKLFEKHVDGNVFFTEKMDGTLIIRYVYNGQVFFRTRGCITLGEFEKPVMDLIREEYPTLLDAQLKPNDSMLFEYTAPDNTVIINYQVPELTYIGRMNHTKLEYFPAYPLSSSDMGLKYAKFHKIGNTSSEIRATVSSWKDSEGVVACIRTAFGYMLMKIKTAEYIKLHSFKYHMTESKAKLIFWKYDIQNIEDLQNYLSTRGLDWEVSSFLQPMLEKYLEHRKKIFTGIGNLQQIVYMQLNILTTRKEQAEFMKLNYSEPIWFGIGMRMFSGQNYKNELDALLLEVPLASVVYQHEAAKDL